MGEKITKMDRQPIISAKDVEITFSLRGKKLNAIRKCSLDLYDGETLAIVGESGSGKSVFTKTFVGMLDVNGKITGGSIMYEGRDMTKFTEKDWLGVRGKKIAMVMQDPMTSLNPLKKIGKQIQESIEHHQGLKGAEAKKAAIEMLAKVGIPDPERRYEQYPHEFSGGMRQRVVIAIAAACRPQILICDEPTTALDVTIQAQILQLIRDLQKELACPLSTSPMTWALWQTWQTAWPSCTPARSSSTVPSKRSSTTHGTPTPGLCCRLCLSWVPRVRPCPPSTVRRRTCSMRSRAMHLHPATSTRWPSTSWQNLRSSRCPRPTQQKPGIWTPGLPRWNARTPSRTCVRKWERWEVPT